MSKYKMQNASDDALAMASCGLTCLGLLLFLMFTVAGMILLPMWLITAVFG